MIENLALIILAVPFFVFVINALFIRYKLGSESEISGLINAFGMGICLLLSIFVIFNLEHSENKYVFSWININNISLDFSVMVDPLTAIMLVVVTGISFLVQIYSIGYMHGDKSYTRYFAYMALFTGSMFCLLYTSPSPRD